MTFNEFRKLKMGDFFWIEDTLCIKMINNIYIEYENPDKRKELTKKNKIYNYKPRNLTGNQICKEVIEYYKLCHKDGRRFTEEEIWNNDKKGSLSDIFELYWQMIIEKRKARKRIIK
jgi:hypothetical protein